jgi:hypothetical protein
VSHAERRKQPAKRLVLSRIRSAVNASAKAADLEPSGK